MILEWPLKLSFWMTLICMSAQLALAQVSAPQQCRNAGGTVEDTGQRNGSSVIIRCVCQGRSFNYRAARCDAGVVNPISSDAPPALAQVVQGADRALGNINARPEFCDENAPITGCPHLLLENHIANSQSRLRLANISKLEFFKQVESAQEKCLEMPGARRLRGPQALEQYLNSHEPYALNRSTDLHACFPLLDNKRKSLNVAEYYYMMNRLKVSLAMNLDGLIALDAVAGKSLALTDVRCDFPEFALVQNACQAAKRECPGQSAIPDLARATQLAETELAPIRQRIEVLETQRKRASGAGLLGGLTGAERQELGRLKAQEEEKIQQLPWMRGETYKNAYRRSGDPGSAITAQFEQDRKDIKKNLEEISGAVHCLRESNQAKSKQKCGNFERTMAKLTQEPPRAPGDTQRDADIDKEFDRVRCHREQRQEVREARDSNKSSTFHLALALTTGGTGTMLRLAGVAGKGVITAAVVGSAEVAAVAWDAAELKNNCSYQSTSTMQNSGVSINENAQCGHVAEYRQATRHYGSCMASVAATTVGAALGAVGVRAGIRVADAANDARRAATAAPARAPASAATSIPRSKRLFSSADLSESQQKGFSMLNPEQQRKLLLMDGETVLREFGDDLRLLGCGK
jgi:hypothetical protein